VDGRLRSFVTDLPPSIVVFLIALPLSIIIGIVAIDLLTGILIGLGLSTARLVYSLAHLDIERVDRDGRIELHLHGAATG